MTVARVKSFSKAAACLGKDRKTISEHIDNFEIDLGYSLFSKNGRALDLTSKGDLLYRRAQLLWADISAFERFAASLQSATNDRISVCFDESIPKNWLKKIQAECNQIGVSVDLLKVSREYGESLLRSGSCQFGLFLAKGQVINAEFYWKALPPISMSAYACSNSEVSRLQQNTVRDLTKYKQRVYTTPPSTQLQYPLIVSDDHVIENDLDLLLEGLSQEESWAFLPNHIANSIPSNIIKLDLDIAQESQALQLQPVLLWASSHPPYSDVLFDLIAKK